MTQHPEDLAERGRHIFEALRRVAEHTDPPDEVEPMTADVDLPVADLQQQSAEPASEPEPEPEPGRELEPEPETMHSPVATDPPPAWEPSPTPEPGAFLPPPSTGWASPPRTEPSAAVVTPPLPPPPAPTVAESTPDAVDEDEPADDAHTVLDAIGDEPVSELTLPRIIAIANQKGGVGKTTTSVNLGAALAELGFRVLVVDLDPQGNATTGLGVNNRNLDSSIYDVVMSDVPIDDCIEPTSLRNLFVAPATIDLAGAEIELVPAFSRELKLRRALHEVRDEYDFTIIDCPPSLGLLTVNGLAAADDVIVPIQCEYYALEGLGQLLKNVALVRTNLNPALEVRGIVLTMYDARTKLSEAVAGDVRQHFGAKVYRNIVPRTVRLSEAPSFGQPITVFDPSSRGAIAYRELAKEVSRGATRRAG